MALAWQGRRNMPAEPAALDFRHYGQTPLHLARSFRHLPDGKDAATLLAGLAEAPCLFSPAPADRRLALYGAGNLGRLARDFLSAVRHEFVLVVDRDAKRIARDLDWREARVLHPDDVPERDKEDVLLAVSVATSPYVPLERSLSEMGFRQIVPFYDLAEGFRQVHPLSNGWFAPPLTSQDQDNTAAVLASWADDTSRAHHLQFLAWRRLREEWTIDAAPVTECARFFIPEVARVLHDREILLDGGAHHGSVTKAFARRTKGRFHRVIAIEPDPANRRKFLAEVAALLPDGPCVTVRDCALAEHAGEASFHDGLGYASQISNTGRLRVALCPIDALGIAPTSIKLHLEGSELAALKGARETLLARRPIVAATVYHNADGIWQTPFWLMQTLPRYRFLFRLDAWCGTGAVVYAIPEERRAP
jgi:FkbM family methyltransferase